MNAAIALFNVQVRILAWPLVAVLVALFLSAWNFFYVDLVKVLAGSTALIASFLSGPLLFGAEYAQGSRDYLLTRPVRQVLVLYQKVMLLLLVAIGSGIVLEYSLPFMVGLWPWGEFVHMFPVTIAVLLNVSLWLSGTTILFKDPIRGLLYGLPLLLVFILFLSIIPVPFLTSNLLSLISSGERLPHLDEGLVIIALVLSPSFFLGALLSLNESVRKQAFRLTPFAIPLLLVVPVYLVLCQVYLSPTGTTHKVPIKNHIGADPNRGFFFKIIVPKMEGDSSNENHVEIGSAFDPSQTVRLPVGKKFVSEVHPWRDDSWILYAKTEGAGHLGFMKPMDSIDEEPSEIEWLDFNGDMVAFEYQEEGTLLVWAIDTKSRATKEAFQVDLESREVSPLEDLSMERDLEVSLRSKNRIYSISKFRSGVQYSDADDQISPPRPIDLPIHSLIVEGTLAIGGKWHGRRGFPIELKLIDTSSLNEFKKESLHVRTRKTFFYEVMESTLEGIGVEPNSLSKDSRYPHEAFVTLGNSYLSLWTTGLGRVFLWKIHDELNAEYIGDAPIPPSVFLLDHLEDDLPATHALKRGTPPIVDMDGRLGYILANQILWLEFPALMKEVDRS